MAVLALGFFLGMRHATDADHVLAVATIVSRYRSARSAAWIGVWWGAGHTLTILLVGGGIVLFGWVIPPRLGLSMEFSVGLMLIVLGLMTLISTLRRVDESIVPLSRPSPGEPARDAHGHESRGHESHGHGSHGHGSHGHESHGHESGAQPAQEADAHHSHAHAHGDYVHAHPHGHGRDGHPHRPDDTPLGRLDRRFGRVRLYQAGRPLVVGMVHGLAGSAAVALLVLTTIRDPRWSVFYLLIFGAGTIAGMMMMTAAIAAPFAYSSRRSARLTRGLRLAAGVLSIAFGLLLAYRIGVVDGLFSSTPAWDPQ